jgi:hypothetical protein
MVYYSGVFCPFHGGARSGSALTMGDAGNELSKHKVDWELEFARLKVNVTFAYWFWCQKRLNELVNSYDGNSSHAWLVVFPVLRRPTPNRWSTCACDWQ